MLIFSAVMDEEIQNTHEKRVKQRERLIYGRHPVLEALKQKIVRQVFFNENIASSGFYRELEQACLEKGVEMRAVDEDYFVSRLGRSNHQGVLAEVTPFSYSNVETIIESIKGLDHAVVLILAHLEDPGNFGAILRSAAAFGVNGVIIPNRRSVSVNATVAKTSAGTLGLVPVAMVANLRNALIRLKDEEMWAVGTDSGASQELSEIEFPSRSVVVMGGEAKGVPPLLLKECDYIVRIQISPDIESLNVSAASAIMLYHASKAV